MLVAAAVAASPVRSIGKDTERPWDVVSVGRGKIAVPKGWRNLDKVKPGMVIFRQGDGIGVPKEDETGSPLQIGLNIEMFPKIKESLRQIADGLAEEAGKTPQLEMIGKELIEKGRLSDGTESMLLTAEFIKEGDRRSLQMKLVVKDAEATVWIVSGHLVGGKDSRLPAAKSKLAIWLRAHLLSLSLDGRKFDARRLETAYRERDQK